MPVGAYELEKAGRPHRSPLNGAVRPVRQDLVMLIATNARGHTVKRPSKPAMGIMLANLGRDNEHMVIERQDDELAGDWYIQVLLRENNTYQLEYRDGAAAEHYQTQTVSQEKVLRALLGWAADTSDWREDFMWNNISSMFEPPAAMGMDEPTA
ncbi:hypothetical protein [Streptomyces sp. NPDC093544]|uniref:hypothetical protein n=1 Tax=Streptomyces sp. NPDC093544 TaxID=3155200 RepID=UPI003423EFB0